MVVDADMRSTSQDVILGDKFNTEDQRVLQSVLDPETSIELILPRQPDPDKLWSVFSVCCTASNKLDVANSKLRPLIGRLLVEVKKYPELYQSRGYKTYDDFISHGMDTLFGIPRSSAYLYRQIAERLPSLSIKQYSDIGITKLRELSHVTREGDAVYPALLAVALEDDSTPATIRDKAAELRHEDRREYDLATLVFTVPKAWKIDFDSFCMDPYVKAYVADNDSSEVTPNHIFMRAVEEARVEWMQSVEHELTRLE